jgi:azurin
VNEARLGPLNQQLIHTSFGSGTAMMVLRDKVGDQWQGAAVPLPGEFKSGVHRAKVHPGDGHIYFCGMQGWGTYTTDPGCLQRMRLTDRNWQMPTSFHLHENGVWLRFAEPVDVEIATKAESHFAQAWNYRYSPGYGSKEYSVTHVNTVGHDRWKIQSAHVGADNMSLFLEIPEIQRCSQLHLQVMPNSNRTIDLYATAHALDAAEKNLPGLVQITDKVFSVHPMVRDLEMLERKLINPWQKKIPKARVVNITTRDNLQFDFKTLRGKPGEAIEIRLRNPDVVPHNWVLIQPNSLEQVGLLSNRLVNDPDAFVHQYVPKSDRVICYTDIVEPSSEFSIFFKLPSEPGRYPYLCTFPGHWMVMNGEFVVEAE